MRECPGAQFSYIADTAHAPYGQRSQAEILERSTRLTQHLLAQGAQCIVVACNTATTQTIKTLRQQFPQYIFVGVEPGIKPAAQHSRSGRIGVMATPGTLASARFAELVAQHAQHCQVTAVPCPGLASAIEAGLPNSLVETLLDEFCQPLLANQVDVVALGCTHYPFVADRVAARLGHTVRILDTAAAVARHTHSLLANWQPTEQAHRLEHAACLQTTGSAQDLANHALGLLGYAWPARHVVV